MLPPSTANFKSIEEEQKELTELARYLHSAIYFNGKSKEMCKEMFHMHW